MACKQNLDSRCVLVPAPWVLGQNTSRIQNKEVYATYCVYRPANVPSNPDKVYKHEGWQGWGHWLGTGNVGVKKDQQFLPFKKALLHARSLKLKSSTEWRQWCKIGERQANMPSHPDRVYTHSGWQGFGHWLGISTVAQQFLPFKKALLYVRSLKLTTVPEWELWRKSDARPANVPSNPHQFYAHNGWHGYGHWLGTANLTGGHPECLPFKKALVYARSLKLTTMTEWEVWRKSGARPTCMPSDPHHTYKDDGWQGYEHWLGTGAVAPQKQQFLSFKLALLHARSLKLKTQKEWRMWCKSGNRPANVPSCPCQPYKHSGWQGWGHWLGTGSLHATEFLPFKKALLYARSLKLKSPAEWKAWSKSRERPANISCGPDATYKHDGWQGYGHWLGTSNLAGGRKLVFLPFKKALLYARTLKLESLKEWQDWAKSGVRPANMPSHPDEIYKHDGWQGWGHWLGTGKQQEFLPFDEALLYARSRKFNTRREWGAWSKSVVRPANVPSRPDNVYKHTGWQGYGHWLGTSTAAKTDQWFQPFEKALLYAHALKLQSTQEWSDWSTSGARPASIPSTPARTYKNDGWQGMRHWLGTATVAL